MRAGRISTFAACALALGLIADCQQAPITGRSQLVLLSPAEADQMGRQAFLQIVKEKKVSNDGRLNKRIETVGRRVVAAVGKTGTSWEFRLIDDPTPNAFALPGGKVGVNTGLFKVAKNDDQLAAVLGHEIAHVMANHSAERVSHQLVLQTGLGIAAGMSGASPQVVDLAAQAATLGIVLPFSRAQESEADEIGLYYMARAGYDPRQAVALWQNFERLGGPKQPQFLSTHPSAGDRIARLRALLPKVMPLYERARQKG